MMPMEQLSDDTYGRIVDHVKRHFGIHLGSGKKTLVVSRLADVLGKLQLSSFDEYLKLITADPQGQAAKLLADRMTTNHTFFMREIDHFRYMSQVVLPYWDGQVRDKDLRIWSAGCSSGEEPYTLAFLLDDYFQLRKREWDTTILATDISAQVLNKALQGVFQGDAVAPLPERWRNNYFMHQDGQYRIIERIKKEVVFRKFNLMEANYPFRKKFHVIFCRNVMIYFDHQTKMNVVSKFYDLLEPGGYLFIGHSETLQWDHTAFEYVMPAVYRKVAIRRVGV
ncbi:CheR family methyltransferase [Paenibacillus sp. strain BS8-2]